MAGERVSSIPLLEFPINPYGRRTPEADSSRAAFFAHDDEYKPISRANTRQQIGDLSLDFTFELVFLKIVWANRRGRV